MANGKASKSSSASDASPPDPVEPAEVSEASTQKICGIVMPIAAMGEDYSEEHWRRVRKILQKAIEGADMKAQLVWENPEVDVIQSAILQNLYENDVVVCDVSGLNPNVMLETGLRLSTKRPTVIVTDRVQRPPFDISTIGYIEYQKDLEYNAISDFIARLSKKISDVARAADENKYHSFVEQFKFETVTPATVTVSSEEYIKDKIDELSSAVRRIERAQRKSVALATEIVPRPTGEEPARSAEAGKIIVQISAENAAGAARAINLIYAIYAVPNEISSNLFEFEIRKMNYAAFSDEEAIAKAIDVLNRFGGDIIGRR